MKNGLILTPNRRLASSLLKESHKKMQNSKITTWESFQILPINTWFNALWDEYGFKTISEQPLLLSTHQERFLWQQIISNSPQGELLLQIQGTAELARKAWLILKQWQVPIENLDLGLTEDSFAFQEWGKEFANTCATNNWLETGSLPDVLTQLVLDNRLEIPKNIQLIGFTEIPPQYLHFLSVFKSKNVEVVENDSRDHDAQINKISLTDEEDEILTMARWAKATSDANPDCYIGCVIPSLEESRNNVEAIFSDVFSKDNYLNLDLQNLPFNISAGTSLIQFPVIHVIFQLLKLNSKLKFETFALLLRSPFIGDAENEWSKRSDFETILRQNNIIDLTLVDLLKESNALRFTYNCPQLTIRFSAFLEYSKKFDSKFSFAKWANIVNEALKILGWPGERSVNSLEYQVIERWLSLLEEFASLENINSEISFNEAIEQLNQIAALTIFQPQSPESSIQILGTLEAVELPFTHLWVMGLDDLNWPPAPKPNPFIPLNLQKQLSMPHATAERELIYCKKLLTQLTARAQTIIFSHAQQVDDIHLEESPLIKDMQQLTCANIVLASYAPVGRVIFNSRIQEEYIDNAGSPIDASGGVKGGVNIFKYQASCPFRAFAELRLHSRKLETPTIGLRNLDRGNIIHKVLELIWKKIISSENLLKLSQEELEFIIKESALIALQKYSSSDNSSRYFELELKRIEKLIYSWMQLEMQRSPFKVIHHEYEQEINFVNVNFKIRVDRIDEMPDGKRVLIDYKTGKNISIAGWFKDRLEEPQLPFYSLFDNKITAVAFAQIHPSKIELKGISQETFGVKSVKTLAEIAYSQTQHWDTHIATWNQNLQKLGKDFLQGRAEVDPVNSEQTCRLCHLQSFCRIQEKNQLGSS